VVYSDNRTTNACICSDIAIKGDTVRVYNIHLKSVGFNNDERHLLDNVVKTEYDESDIRTLKSIIRNLKNSSLERAKQVNILSAHIARSPYPVIICGDFNAPPASYSYHRVRGDLKDAFTEAGQGRSATYNIGSIASLRIDYIIHSELFDSYDYESPRVYISDHFPVMCRFVKRKD
jgi:endonuclease/exonuclease/phosphatase (EEP) superfamily protein YafD